MLNIEQFYNASEIENFFVSNDETKIIFSSNLSGDFDLWAIDLPNNYPYKLTYGGMSNYGIVLDEKRKTIISSFDTKGDEQVHIFSLPLSGGNPEILIGKNHPNENFYLNYISKDFNRIFYTTTYGNNLYLDAYIYDVEKNTHQLIIKGNDYPINVAAVSPNEETLVITKQISNTYITGFIFQNNELTPIIPIQKNNEFIINDVEFITNNELLLITDFNSEFPYLARYTISTNNLETLVTIPEEELQSFQYNAKNNSVYIVTTKGVTDKLYEYYLENKKLKKINSPIDIIEQSFICESGNIYILGRGSTKPQNIYIKKNQNDKFIKITNNRFLGIEEKELVEPDIITYNSQDNLEIESLFYQSYMPNNHTIVWIHGGPQSSEQKQYTPLFQFLVSKGFNLFIPNFRGSTGYGKHFTKSIERDWDYGPRADIISGLDHLIGIGKIIKGNIFASGVSYGGYMTLLLLSKNSEYFKGGVDMFGPTNLLSLINDSPGYWGDSIKSLIGDPEIDFDRLNDQSPVNHLDKIKAPLLVIHGYNDPRVNIMESISMVKYLESSNINVESLFFENEGHGFINKRNQLKAHENIYSFLCKIIDSENTSKSEKIIIKTI